MLERCRPPIMPSATTAERSDSTAARSAIAIAGDTNARTIATDSCGNWGAGRDASIAPKREPIVSTGQPRSCTSAVVAMSATKGAGSRRLIFGHPIRMVSVMAATPMAYGFTSPMWEKKASHFSTNSAGTAPIRSPSRSFTCELKMITAIPLVNPMVTLYGMNLIAPPSFASPRAMRKIPARIVATVRPSTPYFWTMP